MYRRSYIAALLALTFAFGLIVLSAQPTSAAASCTPGPYTVSTSVNLRVGASTTARILASIPSGSTVDVIGERQGTLFSNSTLWCEATFNGVTGFVHSGALISGAGSGSGNAAGSGATTTEVIAGSTIYHVGANRINARSAPNTNAAIVTQLAPNSDVIVTGQAEGTRVNGSTVWYAVTYNGQSMYVHSSLLIAGSVAPAAQPNAGSNLQSPAPQPTSAPAQQPAASFQCPRNCTGARAMGLTPQQAATCPGLDRDRDGVACYGD